MAFVAKQLQYTIATLRVDETVVKFSIGRVTINYNYILVFKCTPHSVTFDDYSQRITWVKCN